MLLKTFNPRNKQCHCWIRPHFTSTTVSLNVSREFLEVPSQARWPWFGPQLDASSLETNCCYQNASHAACIDSKWKMMDSVGTYLKSWKNRLLTTIFRHRSLSLTWGQLSVLQLGPKCQKDKFKVFVHICFFVLLRYLCFRVRVRESDLRPRVPHQHLWNPLRSGGSSLPWTVWPPPKLSPPPVGV